MATHELLKLQPLSSQAFAATSTLGHADSAFFSDASALMRADFQPLALPSTKRYNVADTISEHLLPEPKTVLAGMEMLAQLVTDEVTSKQVGHGCWADAMLASLSCQIWELEKQGYIAWVSLITGGICSVGRPRGQALQVQEQPAG